MTIFAERASESKVLGKPKYSLSVLPVQDLVHYQELTVRQAREALNAEARILNALLHNAPGGYPAFLRRSLRGVMFHIKAALSQLESYIGAGYYQDDSISAVPGVSDSLYNHLGAVKKAKQDWGVWMSLEKKSKISAQSVFGMEDLLEDEHHTASQATGYADYPGESLAYFGYDEEDDNDLGSVFTDVLSEMGKPKKTSDSWGAIGVAVAGAAALVGLYVWRGRK